MLNNKSSRSRSLTVLSALLFLLCTLSSFTLYASTDRGDAPSDMTSIDADLTSPYGEASHTIDTAVYLGSLIDHDATTQSTGLDATGDDNDGSNDDDGVTFPMKGGLPVLDVEESNTISIEASQAGFLNAWIDWNQDGDWDDTGETIATNTPMVAGGNSLLVTPDGFSPHGATYARFRFTSTSVASPSPTGLLPDGEVEDYKISTALPTPENICEKLTLNNGFEQPEVTTYAIPAEDQVYGWGTTPNAPSSTAYNTFEYRNSIEIWRSGFNSVPSYEGNQFAELNAYVPGILYQDVELVPGSTYHWSFAHRGRDGLDGIRVLMGPPDALVQQGVYTTDKTDWVVHNGIYTVPVGQAITRFGFQAHSVSGGDPSRGNFLDDVRIQSGCDFGDAPDSYGTSFAVNGAYHAVRYNGVYLGANDVDREVDAQPSELADGDDTLETDDEDGLAALPTLLDSANSYSVDVTVNNTSGNLSTLAGWIDFDGDGAFDADEGATLSVPSGTTNGLVTLSWGSVPADIKAGDSYLRLRITSDSLASTDAKGLKHGGEVEDYQVVIEPDDDADGISNSQDIDDDNDGILDSEEGGICAGIVPNISIRVDGSEVTNSDTTSAIHKWVDGSIANTNNYDAGYTASSTDDEDITLTYPLSFNASNFTLRIHNDWGGDNNEGIASIGAVKLFDKSGALIKEVTNISYGDGNADTVFYDIPTALNAQPVAAGAQSGTAADDVIDIAFGSVIGVHSIVINDYVQQPSEGAGQLALREIELRLGTLLDSETLDLTTAGYCGKDSDGDGFDDHLDLDSDNDGIPDNIEAQTTKDYKAPVLVDSDDNGLYDTYETSPGAGEGITPVDTDSDDINDYLDLDSDGDGTYDLVESGLFSDPVSVDANNDGRTDNPVGADGWDNTLYPADNYNDPNSNLDTPKTQLKDTDGDVDYGVPLLQDLDYRDRDNDVDRDGIPSSVDIDDDNDGILDVDESYSCVPAGTNFIGPDYFSHVMLNNVSAVTIYANTSDQVPLENYWIDGDTTTGRNSFSWTDTTQPVRLEFELHAPLNVDGFAVANDYGKVGAGDGIREAVVYLYDDTGTLIGTESFPSLLNNNSTVVDNYALSRPYKDVARFVIEMPWTGPGTGPAKPAFQMREIGLFTSRETCLPRDSDSDGIIDSLDLDSDNDGIPDNIEAQTSDDYIAPSATPTDNNSNGLDDIYETGDFAEGEGLTPVDTDGGISDGDGTESLPDYLDLDSDNDGLTDLEESGLGLSGDAEGRTIGIVGLNGWDDSLELSVNKDSYVDVNGKIDDPRSGSISLTDLDNDVSGAAPMTEDLDYRDTDVVLGYTVSGYVFEDSNVSGDLESGEGGIAGVTIILHDTVNDVCRSVKSGANGYYYFEYVANSETAAYVLYEAANEAIAIPTSCPPLAADPTDYFSSTANQLDPFRVDDADISDQNFGDVRAPRFEIDNQKTTSPNTLVTHPHVFTTPTDGSVSFSIAEQIADPASLQWGTGLMQDVNCDAQLDGGDVPLVNPVAVTAGDQVCLLAKVITPANATTGALHTMTLESDFAFAGSSGLANSVQQHTDLTRIIGQSATDPQGGIGQLELVKSVWNMSRNIEGTVALPGETLRYTVEYENIGTGPLNELVIHDSVPEFTDLVSSSMLCTDKPPELPLCAVNDDGNGSLEWAWTAGDKLQAGSKGSVSYRVEVE